MEPRVFISHSSHDKAIADTTCQFLEARGIACWVAPRNVPPGAKYGAAIIEALENASAVVFIFSEHSNRSEQVMNEIERAVSKKKAIFPIKISPVSPSAEMEYFISRHHWVDVTQMPLESALGEVVTALRAASTVEPPVVLRGGTAPSQALLVVEAVREGERLKLSAYEHHGSEGTTLRHYEYWEVSFDTIERTVARLIELLNQAAHEQGVLDATTWGEIQAQGAQLYQRLLSPAVRETMEQSTATDLALHIDDDLVYIPWELLFDGQAFLCRRFSLGRFVSTQQAFIQRKAPPQQHALTMLIVANPQGNLEAAGREGMTLQRELASEEHHLKLELRHTAVSIAAVKTALGECNMLHYAGHADYDPQRPAESGWLLADGKLTAADILRLGETVPVPALVFCNACQSGQTTAWRMTQAVGEDVYGLANAFLLAGAQHYIGSFWAIPDTASAIFAIAFYRALSHGMTIGTALRSARQQLIERYGEASVVWASYMLYGDPTAHYLEAPQQPSQAAPRQPEQPGALRGAPPASPGRRWSWPLGAGAVAAAAILVIGLVALFGKRQSDAPPLPALSLPLQYQALTASNLPPPEKQARVDRLVAEVLQAYKTGKRPEPPGDGWTSAPLILAVLRDTFEPKGAADEALLHTMEQALRKSGRVTIVEREILDKLLAELKLNTSELVDRQVAQRVGKILGAGLLATGRIRRNGAEGALTVRLIETETSQIPASANAVFETAAAADSAVETLAQDLLRQMRQDPRRRYVLQGSLVRVSPTVVLNIGAEQGARRDLLLEVVEALEVGGKTEYFPREDLGRLRITTVQAQTSQAEALQAGATLQVGWKVREVLEP